MALSCPLLLTPMNFKHRKTVKNLRYASMFLAGFELREVKKFSQTSVQLTSDLIPCFHINYYDLIHCTRQER